MPLDNAYAEAEAGWQDLIAAAVRIQAAANRIKDGPRSIDGYEIERTLRKHRPATAMAAIEAGEADFIAFSVPFIANPDLVERLRREGPFNEPNVARFYGGDHTGYTDYPSLEGAPAPKVKDTKAPQFTAALKKLPGVPHLAAIELRAAEGNVVGVIENKPGSQGSVAVYNHLGQTFGAITPEAARKGLEIYAEHTADARQNPGKHPNIDRLIQIAEWGQTLRVKHVFAKAD